MANENVDYEKQFQDDLERAQALSLESLALEKFRNQKLLQESKCSSNNANAQKVHSASVTRSRSITETDAPSRPERHQVKSRPRPGTIAGGAPPNPIIAPPPNAIRRHSATSTQLPSISSEPDLISFTSPPHNSKLIDFCQQLHNSLNAISKQENNQISTASSSQQYGNQPINYGEYGKGPQWKNASQMPNLSTVSQIQGQISLNQMPLLSIANVPSLPPSQAPPKLTINAPPSLPIQQKKQQQQQTSSIRSSSSASSLDVLRVLSKQDNSNLIDLTPSVLCDDRNSVRVSVLEAFDPLLSSQCQAGWGGIQPSLSPDCGGVDDSASVCDSVYDEYDPFEYLYSGSGNNSLADPLYAAVVKSEKAPLSPPPPLPPRAHQITTMDRRKKDAANDDKKMRLYDYVQCVKNKPGVDDAELKAFHRMVKELRSNFKYNNPDSNMGLVVSPMMQNQYKEGTSIKLCVYPYFDANESGGDAMPSPVTFTCDVTCSVEHVTLHVSCELESPSADRYTLKVWGYSEYLVPTTLLSDYEYVHNCIKLEQDVVLSLVPDRLVDRSLARTPQDDQRDLELSIEDLLPNEPILPISRDTLIILLETLEGEMEKVEKAARGIETNIDPSYMPALYPTGAIQAVKAVCKLMGSLETQDITEAVEAFSDSCQHFIPQQQQSSERRSHIEHTGYHIARTSSLYDTVCNNCDRIRIAVQALIEMYCRAFRVNFIQISVNDPTNSTSFISDNQDSVLLRICAIHRPPSNWKHDDYIVAAQVYHGTRPYGQPVLSQPCSVTNGFFPRILFNSWLDMEDVSVCSLARESRLVLVLYGRSQQAPESGENNNSPTYQQEELGWAAIQFFNYEGLLTTGTRLLSLWSPSSSHKLGPAPCAGTHPLPDHPVLGVEIAGPANCLFPVIPDSNPVGAARGDFASLDENTQQQLLDITAQDTLSKPPIEVREVLWEKRHYLYHLPDALPKVLLAAHSWECAYVPDLYGLLDRWTPMSGVHAFELLLPIYPDMRVRAKAVRWIKMIKTDELVDYLPQLVVALRHEPFDDSALARFLLERSLRSPRVAHHLYWLLAHNLPGPCPQNCSIAFTPADETGICSARYHRRLVLMLRALLAISGESLRNCFLSQQLLVKNLYDIAEDVKKTKESHRLNTLCTALDSVHHSLVETPTSLPLSPSLRVAGVHVRSCSYFPSNTLPLKIAFQAPDGSTVPAIFKVGDDLQQDMLTLQMVRIMDKLWLKEGLDLKMVTFACVPTGLKRGMIEMVSSAETLRKIQVELGLTGSFKDKPIAEWLAKHNPSELEYERAVENFTASCAGYSVVTYILGICDRHNDNIMLKTSGHLFHIDFGKFLGDAQMFGNFKRDRTPFVLTSDMAYVINGGDRPSARFHKFVDLCCQAFNVVRSNGNLLLHLFTLMASSGIPGVTTEAVSYVHRALLPGCSKPEAAAIFARLIQSSLKSWFTQFNFFLHNLAQLRFTGDHGDGELLSFVPKTYSMAQDGRLTHVTVVCHQKRYDPDKYYVYIIRVQRESQPHTTDVHRTYKEFCELHQKLCIHFPLAKLHSLPMGMHMGRSNIKQVAEKRLCDIKLFILSLFRCADEIAHSDLVYTFFHPSLRDQQAPEQFTRKVKDRKADERGEMGRLKGQLKLSLHYNRGVLSVMVHHARSLALVGNAQEPSTYVKVYLLPDPVKNTKRKTKVIRRSCHPSFMEMLEYRMNENIVNERVLTATVWNHDPLQENEFLGGVALELGKLDISKEMTEWFPLTNLPR